MVSATAPTGARRRSRSSRAGRSQSGAFLDERAQVHHVVSHRWFFRIRLLPTAQSYRGTSMDHRLRRSLAAALPRARSRAASLAPSHTTCRDATPAGHHLSCSCSIKANAGNSLIVVRHGRLRFYGATRAPLWSPIFERPIYGNRHPATTAARPQNHTNPEPLRRAGHFCSNLKQRKPAIRPALTQAADAACNLLKCHHYYPHNFGEQTN